MSAARADAPAGGMVPLIDRKKRGGELTADEMRWLCSEFAAGRLPDYQVASWLMAVCWRGMSQAETLAMTRAMVATGETLDWSDLPSVAVDKHSTGGVGDKTSLVLVPLLAAAGLYFVKMSGRGLGHTGGTLDKLEAIPAFRVGLSLDEIRAQVQEIGCALVGQSGDLVPADGALYALRDVTATVESLPLIASSIMSKKLAAGAPVIVLDVKYGSGAFMKSIEEARELARAMVAIGSGAGRRVRAVLSPMAEPLGRAVGNAIEVREAVETLRGGGPEDLWELTLELGAQAMVMAGAAPSEEAARGRLTGLRDSGAAAERFARLIEAQGGDARVVSDPDRLPRSPHVQRVMVEQGPRWVRELDARTVGEAALELGAGRRIKTDPLDHGAGILLLAKVGARVDAGEALAEIHASTPERAQRAAALLRDAYRLDSAPVPVPVPAPEVIGAEK